MQKVLNIYNREEDILNYLPTDVMYKGSSMYPPIKSASLDIKINRLR